MWKTFQAEFVALWKSRLRFASWIILLFMPLIYGFLFLSSFWSPFKNTDQLPIVVVNLDKDSSGQASSQSKALISVLTYGGKDLVFNGGTSEYKIHVTEPTEIYNTKEDVEKDVNSGKYSAAFVIPKGYGDIVHNVNHKLTTDFTHFKPDLKGVTDALKSELGSDKALIDFYNSFKVSYVAGEMTNMGSTLYKLITDLVFPGIKTFENLVHSVAGSLDSIMTSVIQPTITKGIGAATAALSKLPPKITPALANTFAAVAIDKIREKEDSILIVANAFPDIKSAFELAKTSLYTLATTQDQTIVDTEIAKIKSVLPGLIAKINGLTTSDIQTIINGLKTKVESDLTLGNVLVNHKTYGKREGVVGEHDILNTYGYGLSPYFLSIVLWAGALLMVFLFPNKRYIKTENTFKNMAGKTAVWVLTGWIQTLLLFAVISIPGIFGSLTYHLDATHTVTIQQCINIGGDQWQLILFGLFASTMFMLIVRGIVYTIRVADIGLFICVILLILQLVSSGGTFPASMQPGFFKFLHKILPFTYTVSAIREIYWDTDSLVVLKDVGILLIIPAIFTATSIISGYFWDKKTHYKRNGKTFYRSMDKNVGSL